MQAPGCLLARDSQGLSRCLLVAVSWEMPPPCIVVCAAAGFLHHILTLSTQGLNETDMKMSTVLGSYPVALGKTCSRLADSDCSRCQLSSWTSEIFLSQLAVSRGHSQLLNISLQLMSPSKLEARKKITWNPISIQNLTSAISWNKFCF